MSKLVQLKDKNKNNIFSVPYFPIGYIYLSTSSINPSEIFGGVWEPIKDRFLLLAGDTYTGGQTGGEATHKLTINELPSHTHNASAGEFISTSPNVTPGTVMSFDSGQYKRYSMNSTSSTGGSKAHNNMPPYLAVYGWVKVSN